MSNQYLTFDVAKANQVQQLIVGRQGDNALKSVSMLFWDGEKNRPYDLTGKQVYFEALKPDNSHIVDYAGVTITDPKYGLATYAFNEQVFTVQGMMQQAFFKISETDSNGNVTTDSSLEVSINVLSNRVEFGIKSEDYLSEYDRLVADVEKKFDDYANTVSGNIADVAKAHDDIQALMQQISDNNIVTLNEFNVTKGVAQTALDEERALTARYNTQEDDLVNSMNAKIAQISSVPETFANLSALQSTYPNGKTGLFVTADTGHKYIWANGGWTDAGFYQSVGIADGSIVNQSLSGLVIDAFIYSDLVNGFSDTKFDIDKTNQTLSVKGVYLNYANKSIQIPDATININNQVNILYFDQTTGVLGVKDSIDKLENSYIYLGVIRQGLSVVDLKVTMYSIDGVIVKPYITNKFLDRKMFIYGDLIFNIDEKQLILNSVYLNYDYGDGLAIPNSTIDLSSIDNKVVYFDVNNQTVKTDYYGHLGDSDIVIGYFNPSNPSTSFNNTVSRVLFIKNGVTYSPEQFKIQGSTLSNVYMSTFGDSITSDQVSGTGTQIIDGLGAKNGGNFATGWSTASDWHNGDTNTTVVTLAVPNNTDTNDNVLSNQVRRQLQYTTASGQPITWTHPIYGTFVLDSSIGTGLGNTDKVPSVIYIAISTNDGKNDSVPVVDDTDVVFGQSYSQLTRNSIASGLRWAIETLQSAYPDVKIFIASPLQTDRISGHMSFTDGNLKREIVKKVARFTSVNYIDSFSESGFSALKSKELTVDGIHPSDEGKNKLVNYVTREIRNKLR